MGNGTVSEADAVSGTLEAFGPLQVGCAGSVSGISTKDRPVSLERLEANPGCGDALVTGIGSTLRIDQFLRKCSSKSIGKGQAQIFEL